MNKTDRAGARSVFHGMFVSRPVILSGADNVVGEYVGQGLAPAVKCLKKKNHLLVGNLTLEDC